MSYVDSYFIRFDKGQFASFNGSHPYLLAVNLQTWLERSQLLPCVLIPSEETAVPANLAVSSIATLLFPWVNKLKCCSHGCSAPQVRMNLSAWSCIAEKISLLAASLPSIKRDEEMEDLQIQSTLQISTKTPELRNPEYCTVINGQILWTWKVHGATNLFHSIHDKQTRTLSEEVSKVETETQGKGSRTKEGNTVATAAKKDGRTFSGHLPQRKTSFLFAPAVHKISGKGTSLSFIDESLLTCCNQERSSLRIFRRFLFPSSWWLFSLLKF